MVSPSTDLTLVNHVFCFVFGYLHHYYVLDFINNDILSVTLTWTKEKEKGRIAN